MDFKQTRLFEKAHIWMTARPNDHIVRHQISQGRGPQTAMYIFRRHSRTAKALLLISCCTLTVPAIAQGTPQPVDYSDLKACGNIKNEAASLACFKALAQQAGQNQRATPEQSGQKTVPQSAGSSKPGEQDATTGPDVTPPPLPPQERQQTPAVQKDMDGRFGLPRKPQRSTDSDDEQELSARIIRFNRNQNGNYTFYLDNGQVWRETSGSTLQFTRKQANIRIKKGAIGGYRMIVEGMAGTGRVKRVK